MFLAHTDSSQQILEPGVQDREINSRYKKHKDQMTSIDIGLARERL